MMYKSAKRRLNIFIDETGEFGFSKGSASLYGVSLVFHEQNADIRGPVLALERKFAELNFHDMVHMGELVTGHGAFAGMNIAERRKIYDCLYRFATQVEAKYHTIIIEKQQAPSNELLIRRIKMAFKQIISGHLEYLQSFSEIVIYYDGGQAPLNGAINETFGKLGGYRQKSRFDHTEKKLFQVADMLTYVDKLIYKYTRRRKMTKTENAFFGPKRIRVIIRANNKNVCFYTPVLPESKLKKILILSSCV